VGTISGLPRVSFTSLQGIQLKKRSTGKKNHKKAPKTTLNKSTVWVDPITEDQEYWPSNAPNLGPTNQDDQTMIQVPSSQRRGGKVSFSNKFVC
jgi:hypothetical protein